MLPCKRSLISEIADEVIVMYQGNIVEKGSVISIFKTPKATYTKALLASRPTLAKRLRKLPTIASLADESFKDEEITAQQRAFRHKKLYTQKPLLEVHNLSKNYYSNAGLFKPKGGGKSSERRELFRF